MQSLTIASADFREILRPSLSLNRRFAALPCNCDKIEDKYGMNLFSGHKDKIAISQYHSALKICLRLYRIIPAAKARSFPMLKWSNLFEMTAGDEKIGYNNVQCYSISALVTNPRIEQHGV